MSSIEYNLFRAKFIIPNQPHLFEKTLRSEEYMMESIKEKPSLNLRRGSEWHIGNFRPFSLHSGYFTLGRKSISTIPKFDIKYENFIEVEQEVSPFTHCVFDSKIGIIGISRKNELIHKTSDLARRLGQVLTEAEIIKKHRIAVEILPIPDPDGFIKEIKTAYRVMQFAATFRAPNPFDADLLFQRPMAAYIHASKGLEGETMIKGEDLDRDVISDVTRSTAATGNEAKATIRRSEDQKKTTINLNGYPIKRNYSDKENHPEQILADLTNQYFRVRHA